MYCEISYSSKNKWTGAIQWICKHNIEQEKKKMKVPFIDEGFNNMFA